MTTPPVPSWFTAAISVPYQIKTTHNDGCTIEYHQWGSAGKPLLLFVHGNGGHANWWDFIAPSFMEDYCVCALDLPGMGNSGYRDEYHFDGFADDVIAIARHAGYTREITLIGHSMGGIITMRAAENYPGKIKALIIIDSPLIFRRSDDASEQHKPLPPARFQLKAKKFYPDAATTLGRYHLVPTQPCKNTFLVQHVAEHSIRQYTEGWSWKFDDGINLRFKRSDRPPFDIEKVLCPMAYIYGGKSALVPQSVIADIHVLLKNKGPLMEIKDAHHHVMLDEPLELIEKLKAILKSQATI